MESGEFKVGFVPGITLNFLNFELANEQQYLKKNYKMRVAG
jgi:hypothetical protein